MAWRARLDQYSHLRSTNIVEIVTIYEQVDTNGQVTASLPRTWQFTAAEAPNVADFAVMMLSDMEQMIVFRANLADYEAMKATPVEIPDPPGPLFPMSVGYVSQTDQAIMAMKMAVKPALIDFIQANPLCTYAETLAFIEAGFGANFRGLVEALMPVYTQGAYAGGLIPEATFDAFRDWIVITPREILLTI
jgi:hypothetical protein